MKIASVVNTHDKMRFECFRIMLSILFWFIFSIIQNHKIDSASNEILDVKTSKIFQTFSRDVIIHRLSYEMATSIRKPFDDDIWRTIFTYKDDNICKIWHVFTLNSYIHIKPKQYYAVLCCFNLLNKHMFIVYTAHAHRTKIRQYINRLTKTKSK